MKPCSEMNFQHNNLGTTLRSLLGGGGDLVKTGRASGASRFGCHLENSVGKYSMYSIYLNLSITIENK